MGYNQDDYLKRGFMQFQNTRSSRRTKRFLSHTRNDFITQELGRLDISTVLSNLRSEFHNKYRQIYSIYFENGKIELTNSTTKEELKFNPGDVIRSTYDCIEVNFKVNFEWIPTELGIQQSFKIETELEACTWNLRRIQVPISGNFSEITEEPVVHNYKWDEDYCLDILPYKGEVVTIWICFRKYT